MLAAHLAQAEMNVRSREAYQLAVRQEIERVLASDRYSDPRRLERFGFKAFSQGDEDGIIQEIFRRIGAANRVFVEIGVGSGSENNTVYLLHSGWTGTWIDASPTAADRIRQALGPAIGAGRLRFTEAFVTAENINALLQQADVPGEPDFFSLDIDGNDYHVWKAIAVMRPRVVAVEYNAKFAPPVFWVMPYNPDHRWAQDDCQGASLVAMTELGSSRGYALVGCSITGGNAFFVRRDLIGEYFHPPYVPENFYQPARYYLVTGMVSGHPPSFVLSADG
jgi:hypothetical protein